MPRLSRAQEEARLRLQRAAGSGLAPARLGRAIAEAVAIAVPCDGYRLFGIDPRTLLVNRLLAASDDDAWARTEWLREVYLAAEPLWYLELPNLIRANLRSVAFQERQTICWGYPREVLGAVDERDHERLFHDLRSPVGGTLLATFVADAQPVAALQWYRRDPKRPFRAGDVAFVSLLAPAIGRAIASSLSREQAWRDGDMPDASGILVLSPEGEVRFATPAGEAWCAMLDRIERTDGDPLPTSVRSAIAALRSGDAGPAAGAVNVSLPGGRVRVEASPAGSDGAVAVVLAPERLPGSPSAPAAWPLTPQERQVVDLLIGGLGNRQIADRLFVSEHTVEWHLRHAYEKLEVGSRGQLLARVFREVYLPTFEDGDANVRDAMPSPGRQLGRKRVA